MINRMPNVLCIAWDDASIATWNAFGGLVDTPAMTWLAARGLRFTQWHTPALPSASRASLLTARNCRAHAMAGAGAADRWPSGRDATIPPDAATLAEILRDSGYRTYCVGEWDLGHTGPGTLTDRRDTWPLARGFDRFYGFLRSRTSPWYPDLVYDDRSVDPPYSPAEGYHLSMDLAYMAMEFIEDSASTAPGQPWLCYLSLGGTNGPDAAPREWADACASKLAMGYDQYRQTVLGTMKRAGIVPDNTGLAPADGNPAWHSLSQEQKKRSIGLAEVPAGLLSFTDHQIGRLLAYLKESGQFRHTLVIACATGGTRLGQARQNGQADVDAAGIAPSGPAEDATICAGWSWAFAAPYSPARQQTVGGSAPSPLIISFPREMEAVAGGVRDQYHHAVDIVPTILDCAGIDWAGIEPPPRASGCPQSPLHGVSMRYTFTAPAAHSARRTQLYHMPGTRAIYHDGWRAVTRHGRWELYHVRADRSESRDVAARYPEKLAELIALWRAEESGTDPRHPAKQARAVRSAGAGSSVPHVAVEPVGAE